MSIRRDDYVRQEEKAVCERPRCRKKFVPRPKHPRDRVAKTLLEMISTMKPGERLPSEKRLSTALSTNQMTLRGVLVELRELGATETKLGHTGGHFVVDPMLARGLKIRYTKFCSLSCARTESKRRHKARTRELRDPRVEFTSGDRYLVLATTGYTIVPNSGRGNYGDPPSTSYTVVDDVTGRIVRIFEPGVLWTSKCRRRALDLARQLNEEEREWELEHGEKPWGSVG